MPDEFDSLLDRLTTLEMFDCSVPATPGQIDEIERSLCVVLPVLYRRLLDRWGCVGWFGREILGARPADPEVRHAPLILGDCVSTTLEARSPESPGHLWFVEEPYIAISTDGGGGYIVIFAKGTSKEGQVHYCCWDCAPGSIQVWPDLHSYLSSQFEESGS